MRGGDVMVANRYDTRSALAVARKAISVLRTEGLGGLVARLPRPCERSARVLAICNHPVTATHELLASPD